MPIELNVIRSSDFVCLDANERLDFEESKKALQKLALACQKRGLCRAILDIRDVPVPDKPLFTTAELAALVGAFHAAGFSRQGRLAVLYKRDVYGGIRNFTFFSRMHGLQVQAFHEFETAIYWLWQDLEKPAEEKQGAAVPILRRQTKKPTVDFVGRNRSPVVPGSFRRLKHSRRID